MKVNLISVNWGDIISGSLGAPKLRVETIRATDCSVSVRLGPESFLPPALDTEIIKVASAQADLGDRGE